MSSNNSPGPAEILRAAQRDEDFIRRIQQDFTELIQQFFGQRFSLRWRNWLEYISRLIYFSLTNLSGFQTLGEEYAGILQVDSTFRRIPTRKKTAIMIFLQTFGKSILEKTMKQTNMILSTKSSSLNTATVIDSSEPSSSHYQKNWLIKIGKQIVQIMSFCLPLMTQLHLTLFFFNGKFYHFSKRLTGIHYILVRKWFANQTQQTLKYLVWLSMFNLFITILRETISFIHENSINKNSSHSTSSTSIELLNKKIHNVEMEEEGSHNIGKKCSLCLEIRKQPSVTPCGHLFCWNCILDWLSTKPECPICRDQVTPSRIVPLQNYI